MTDTNLEELEAQIVHYAGEVWQGKSYIHTVVAKNKDTGAERIVGVRVDDVEVLTYGGPRSTERIHAALKAMYELKPGDQAAEFGALFEDA